MNATTLGSSGSERLIRFINEREAVRKKKEAGLPKPWSDDPVFQTTYFCNVHREDDRVTRWLRANWLVDDRNYEFAMCMARLINKPLTLVNIGFPYRGIDWESAIRQTAMEREEVGQPFWGNAYVVTTHGQRMDKVQYLIGCLQGAHKVLPLATLPGTCAAYYRALQGLEGFGSFMAAQVVADLKNTVFHPLANAPDWWSFVAMGPGSKRGLNRVLGLPPSNPLSPQRFEQYLAELHLQVKDRVPKMCAQDLQNCLCEFDKYERVRLGEGRSKRKYSGQ